MSPLTQSPRWQPAQVHGKDQNEQCASTKLARRCRHRHRHGAVVSQPVLTERREAAERDAANTASSIARPPSCRDTGKPLAISSVTVGPGNGRRVRNRPGPGSTGNGRTAGTAARPVIRGPQVRLDLRRQPLLGVEGRRAPCASEEGDGDEYEERRDGLKQSAENETQHGAQCFRMRTKRLWWWSGCCPVTPPPTADHALRHVEVDGENGHVVEHDPSASSMSAMRAAGRPPGSPR